MNRDEIFSSLKCFIIANSNFLTKREIYFFCPENGFQTNVSHFQLLNRNPCFLLSAPLASPISVQFNVQQTSHSELGQAHSTQTCQSGDTLLLCGSGEVGVLHFSWDHSCSYLLMHDILYRDVKDPWHTASSSLSLQVWHRISPSRHLFFLIFGNSLTLTENQEGEQRFSSAQFGLLCPQQPWRYPKAPAVCPFLVDLCSFAGFFLHSFFFFNMSSFISWLMRPCSPQQVRSLSQDFARIFKPTCRMPL